MKIEELLTEASDKEQRLAIQQGGFGKDTAFSIKHDIRDIIKENTNDQEWQYNSSWLDQGLQYTGTDTETAHQTISDIIGKIYGYFIDVPMRERTFIKKSERQLGEDHQEVWTVSPQNGESQIEFFKFTNKPELGVLMRIDR